MMGKLKVSNIKFGNTNDVLITIFELKKHLMKIHETMSKESRSKS